MDKGKNKVFPEVNVESVMFPFVEELEATEQARLKVLLDLTGQVVPALDLRGFLRGVFVSVRRLMLCDGGCVFLQGQVGGELEMYALDFLSGDTSLRQGKVSSIDNTVAGHVFQTGNVWTGICGQALELSPGGDPPFLLEASGITCMLPLPGRHRILGTFGVVRNQSTPYDDDELDFLIQLSKQVAVGVENVLLHEENRQLKNRLSEESVRVEDEIPREAGFEEIVGRSEALRQVLRNVEIVAPTDSTVLICGETGTGKELIARAIHNRSPRQQKAFVKLNCAAIPTGLLESELFGHERGAFTGAIAQRIGRLNWRTRERYFWMRSGKSRWSYRRSFFEYCRRESLNVSEVSGQYERTRT